MLPDARDVEVSSLRAPKAGVSNETFLLDVGYRAGGRTRHERLVARLEPTDFLVFPEYDLERQYTVMARLAGTRVPVPRVRWLQRDPGGVGRALPVVGAVQRAVP